jgi:hypothetical protein
MMKEGTDDAPTDEEERKDEETSAFEPTTLYVGGEQPVEPSGTLLIGDHPAAGAVQPPETGLASMEQVEQPPVVTAPTPPVSSDPVLPPHIVGKGFVNAAGIWRVVLPSGRAVALNTEYHGITQHEDGSVSVDKLVELGPFVGKLVRGVWRVDHPEV